MTDHAKLLEDLKWSLSIRREGDLRFIRLEHQIDATAGDVDEIIAAAWVTVENFAAAIVARGGGLATDDVRREDTASILAHVLEGRRESLMPLSHEKTIELIAEGVLAVVLGRLGRTP